LQAGQEKRIHEFLRFDSGGFLTSGLWWSGAGGVIGRGEYVMCAEKRSDTLSATPVVV